MTDAAGPADPVLLSPGSASATEAEAGEEEPPPRATGGRSAAAHKGQRVYVGNLSWTTSWQDLKVRARAGVDDDARAMRRVVVTTGTNSRVDATVHLLMMRRWPAGPHADGGHSELLQRDGRERAV
jgi:hypothetical protein